MIDALGICTWNYGPWLYITCQIIKPELYNYDKKQSLEAQQDQLCEEFVFVPCSVCSENLMGSKPKVGLKTSEIKGFRVGTGTGKRLTTTRAECHAYFCSHKRIQGRQCLTSAEAGSPKFCCTGWNVAQLLAVAGLGQAA